MADDQIMKNSILLTLIKHMASIACGMGKQKKLFILIYHRVLDEPDYLRPGDVDKTAFTWQMELLSKYFNVLPLHNALQLLQKNELPPRAVSITFDDGYADNFTNALPILKRFNLSSVFFIAHGFINGGRMWNDTVIEAIRHYAEPELDLTDIGLGCFDVVTAYDKNQAVIQILHQIKHLPPILRDEYTNHIAEKSGNIPSDLMMTSEQVIELYANGMEIGGHTVNHPILAKLDLNTARQEISDNKKYLENLLNTSLRLFAYPNGKPIQDYLPEQIQLVKEAGYKAAVSTQNSVADFSSDPWQLPRFTPWDNTPLKFMLRMIYKYYKA